MFKRWCQRCIPWYIFIPTNCILEGTFRHFKNVGYLPVEKRSEKYIGETLSDELVGLTESAAEMMYEFLELQLQGKKKAKNCRNCLSIMAETNIYFDSDNDFSDDDI